jgi:hypothetical protein
MKSVSAYCGHALIVFAPDGGCGGENHTRQASFQQRIRRSSRAGATPDVPVRSVVGGCSEDADKRLPVFKS